MKQTSISEGEEHSVVIETEGAKGDGMVRIDGFVVFVPGAKEGNTYKIRITKVKERFGFGEIID